MSFWTDLVVNFFVALGMVVGGALLGAVGAVLTQQPPMEVMVTLASRLKIWALVSTLGGTMDTLRVIESGVLERQLLPVGRQFALLVAAFLGCQAGFWIVRSLAGGDHL